MKIKFTLKRILICMIILFLFIISIMYLRTFIDFWLYKIQLLKKIFYIWKYSRLIYRLYRRFVDADMYISITCRPKLSKIIIGFKQNTIHIKIVFSFIKS